MITGSLPSRIGAYDNGAEFPASIPTIAHHLRAQGYRTCLAGKMHFIGPDQLHGFEERPMTDVYPAGFDWIPDWELADVMDRLAEVRVPTLVLVGSDDEITPPDTARAMAQLIPGAECHVVPAAGHLSPLEQPAATNRLVDAFLQGLG